MPPTPRKPAAKKAAPSKKTTAAKKPPRSKAELAAATARKLAAPATPAPANLTPTPADQWVKKGAAELEGIDLPLPSGNVARVKRVGLMELLAGGHIPDSLTPVAEEAVRKGKGLPKLDAQEMLKDPEKLADVETLMRNVLVACVVAPQVLPVPTDKGGDPIPFDKRKPGLYADEVLDGDKMYIMNFAFGGSADLARFREEHGAAMADVLAGADVEDET